jgi:YD repeat-containing protein
VSPRAPNPRPARPLGAAKRLILDRTRGRSSRFSPYFFSSLLVDGKGQRTSWSHDVQGRVTAEIRADGTTTTTYAYDLAGRLKTITDPKQQVTTYAYAADNATVSVTFANAQLTTPSITYTHDSNYDRVVAVVDGIGTTSYTYHPVGSPGAQRSATVDGPLVNDTIAYTYDLVGRVTQRTIDGAANVVTWAYDALGRVTSETSELGTFDYSYDGATSRLALVAYPNGQTSGYSYLPTLQDHRLQTHPPQIP